MSKCYDNPEYDKIDDNLQNTWKQSKYVEPEQEILPEFTLSKNIFDKISDLPKTETLEEAAYRLSAEKFEPKHTAFMLGVIEGAKWKAERMYSEEEVLELLNDCRGENPIDINKWFEQNKNK